MRATPFIAIWFFLSLVASVQVPCQNDVWVTIKGNLTLITPGWYNTYTKEFFINCDAMPCICWNHYFYWYINGGPPPNSTSSLFPNGNIEFHYKKFPNDQTRIYADKCKKYFREKNALSCFDFNGQCDEVPYASTYENQDSDTKGIKVQTSCIPANQNNLHGRCLGFFLKAFGNVTLDNMAYTVNFLSSIRARSLNVQDIWQFLINESYCNAGKTNDEQGWKENVENVQFYSKNLNWGAVPSNFQLRASHIWTFFGMGLAGYIVRRFRTTRDTAQNRT